MFRSSISSKTAFLIPIHTVTFGKMVKRAHPDTENTSCLHVSSQKRSRVQASTSFSPKKIATPEAAAAVDADPPFFKLKTACQNRLDNVAQGRAVMYWMRLADLRINDNRALSLASAQAQKDGVPLIALFIISPQDYIAHDRSAHRIDFVLRNLSSIKDSFNNLKIPFLIETRTLRTTIPSSVISILEEYGCTRLFANIECEVDELRRDIKVSNLAKRQGIDAQFVDDKYIIPPGVVVTKQNKAYAVYSPFLKNWLTTLNNNIPYYLADYACPKANDNSMVRSQSFASIFDATAPTSVPGFELDEKVQEKMKAIWPAGENVAIRILHNFLNTKARSSQLGAVDPLASGSEQSDTNSRVSKYDQQRDRADRDTTSRLSPYLASGVLSARSCVRETMILLQSDGVKGDGVSGIGRWVQEIAWRDFYANILASFPRVSMGRPFNEKFSAVVWENHQVPADSAISHNGTDGDLLVKWKTGKTGVPIVDAAMRCLNEMGWMHNRTRMICAMYLTKDLMIDWRVGERYFMEKLIDGDLASNNGGWQWCASTGADPCPYFRIFNPYTQSLKADPTGEFIRTWVPELAKVHGPDLHNPSVSMADKLDYPRAAVSHSVARDRALRRFKNPGEA